MDAIKEIAEFLQQQKAVSIIAHINPDGDAIGSMASLGMALEQCGVQVGMYECNVIAEKFRFLPCYEKFEQLNETTQLADVVVVVDCATLERTGLTDFPIDWTTKTIVNIDHHLGNPYFGAYNYVDETASANCENVFRVIKALPMDLNWEIATALYLGISTDSGSFKYDAVTAQTHRIAAELLDAGAKKEWIRLYMYESISKAKFALERYVYSNVEFFFNGQVASAVLSKKLLEETKADSADVDGVVNILKDIDGVEVAMLFREREDGLKVSLRSKERIDVNKIATQFGGGGHLRAAGATLKMSYAQAKDALLPIVHNQLEEGNCGWMEL